MAFAHEVFIAAIAQRVSEANDDAELSEQEACTRVRAWINGPGKASVNAVAIIAIEAIAEAYLELQREKWASGDRE